MNDRRTRANLSAAFAEEAGAALRYLYLADLADIEGHREAAARLRDWARSATGNAHGHLDCLRRFDGGGSTTDGLRSEIGHLLESATYPAMVGEALDEGCTDVAGWLDTLVTYHRSHVDDLRELLADVGGQP